MVSSAYVGAGRAATREAPTKRGPGQSEQLWHRTLARKRRGWYCVIFRRGYPECRAMISDPIEFELFKNSLFSIADEMALTIFRTTYSGVLKDNMDYSTAIFDGSGKLAAQGLTLPGHLGSMPTAMAAIQEAFAGRIEPGDVFILNDPFQGGMHLPDIFVFKPIFSGGSPLAYAATVCHHTDVGGRVPGSNASDSTEIYQEGLRIPPLKLFDRGARNET